jgi:uncharacterized protein YggE
LDTKPDTLKVSASYKEELSASHADLFITVRGSSLVGGDQAMKKAREVSQLVDELVRFGIPAEKVHLQGVHLESSSGPLLKSSSAFYRLRLRCDQLDQLPGLLEIISSQKNATLERIDWQYPEEEARGLETAIRIAEEKAGKIASSLGVRLLGIYDFMENNFDEERPPMPFMAQAVGFKSRDRGMPEEPGLGMEIQHSKTIHTSVDIWYRVSPFEES